MPSANPGLLFARAQQSPRTVLATDEVQKGSFVSILVFDPNLRCEEVDAVATQLRGTNTFKFALASYRWQTKGTCNIRTECPASETSVGDIIVRGTQSRRVHVPRGDADFSLQVPAAAHGMVRHHMDILENT